MKGRKHTPEQIVRKLREADRLLAEGQLIPEAADDVARILDQAAAVRGGPKFIRCDNGPEFVAAAIRDWCRFSGTGASFIEPGSSWQNPYVESFNARARDELFSREVFDTVRGARVLYADWWHRYNHHHPHSSLGWMTPAAYAAAEMGRVPEPTP